MGIGKLFQTLVLLSILALVSQTTCQTVFPMSTMNSASFPSGQASVLPMRFGESVSLQHDYLGVGAPSWGDPGSGTDYSGLGFVLPLTGLTASTSGAFGSLGQNNFDHEYVAKCIAISATFSIAVGNSMSEVYYGRNTDRNLNPFSLSGIQSTGTGGCAILDSFVVIGFPTANTQQGSVSALNVTATNTLFLIPSASYSPNPVTQSGAGSSLWGSALALSPNYCIGGAPGYKGSGGAFIYPRRGGNTGLQGPALELTAIQGTTGGDKIGSSVAISSDDTFVVVGGPSYSTAGGAWVYENTATWTSATPVALHTRVPVALTAGAKFGSSVGISGVLNSSLGSKYVIGVGAPGAGIVYLFYKKNSTWTYLAQFEGSAADEFGYSLSFNSNAIAVGAPNASVDGLVYLAYVDCDKNSFGPKCTPCNCVNGTCSSGLTGTGNCTVCNFPDLYGATCASTCSCPVNISCVAGATGSGACIDCNGRYGKDCTSLCAATCPDTNGVCDSGFTGTGACLSCNDGYAGASCTIPCPTTCEAGTCNQTLTGNGNCGACVPGSFGVRCSICTCINGTCIDGVNGTGHCSVCTDGFYGNDCNNTCLPCVNGTCLSGLTGDGSCNCTYPGHVANASRYCGPPSPTAGGSTTASTPTSSGNTSSGGDNNANTSPIPGVSQTIFLVIVIVAPLGLVIIIAVISILAWKFGGKGKRKFDSDDENDDSVSM